MRHLAILAALLLSATAFTGEGGTLKGSVKVDGELPPLAPIPVDPAKAAGCKCQNVPNPLAVDPATKGIQWVAIRIMGVAAPAPAAPFAMPVIDQAGCTYAPRTVIAPVGGSVDFLNPEAIAHAIMLSPMDDANEGTNQGMPANLPRMTIKKKGCFAAEGAHLLLCAPHGWMKGLVIVHDPRFVTVTPADGSFEIKDVPPGKYTVNVTHESFEKTIDVEIKAGEVTPLDVKHTLKK